MVGHAVLSNTFRQPGRSLAKAAVVLDHATDGRFVLGLGAGWFEGEHEPFGLELPPIGRRIDRLVSAVDTLRALWSADAAAPPGVTRADPFYPLAGRGQRPAAAHARAVRRSISAARVRAGSGSPPGSRPAGSSRGSTPATSVTSARSGTQLLAALEAEGRDPAGLRHRRPGRHRAGPPRAGARRSSPRRGLIDAGATHVVLGMPAALGPAGLDDVVAEILVPLREATA